MIYLILIEDDIFAQKGVTTSLLLTDSKENEFQFIATRTDGADLLTLYQKHQHLDPVILLDLKLENSRPGALAAEELLQVYPKAKIVVYSSYIDSIVLAVLRAIGVLGFVSKGLNSRALCKALETVSKGNEFFCESTKKILQSSLPALSTVEDLSGPEKIIIYLRHSKFSFEDIAKYTCRTVNSVYSHQRRAFKKLDPTIKRLIGLQV